MACQVYYPKLLSKSFESFSLPSIIQFSSVAQLCPTLRSHGLQHTRPPCPSPTPGVYSNSCPLSRWCHPTISSSVVLSPPAFNLSQHQGLFQWVGPFAWGGQGIVASASASVLLMKIQDWFPSGWTGWISLQSKGLSGVFSSTTVQKHQFFGTWLLEDKFYYIQVFFLLLFLIQI